MKVRNVVKVIKPYFWEPSDEEVSRKFGLKPQEITRFDTNTVPFKPLNLISQLSKVLPQLKVNEYPSFQQPRLSLSRYLGRKLDQITFTAGADEALDVVAKTLIDPGCEVLVSDPTYSMYKFAVQTMGGKVVSVDRRGDFLDNVDALLGAVNPKTRAIFLNSPNNPTGNSTPKETIVRLLEESGCTVVVDECYAEFSGETALDLVDKYVNLVVIRTFSKAFSLAGIRVGYMVAHEETVKLLNIMKPPSSISIISLTLAELALKNTQYMRQVVQGIIRERQRLTSALKEIRGLITYPSEANFILIKFKKLSAITVHKQLQSMGIIARDVSDHPMLEGCLRFAIRTDHDNNKLIIALRKVMKEAGY